MFFVKTWAVRVRDVVSGAALLICSVCFLTFFPYYHGFVFAVLFFIRGCVNPNLFLSYSFVLCGIVLLRTIECRIQNVGVWAGGNNNFIKKQHNKIINKDKKATKQRTSQS